MSEPSASPAPSKYIEPVPYFFTLVEICALPTVSEVVHHGVVKDGGVGVIQTTKMCL